MAYAGFSAHGSAVPPAYDDMQPVSLVKQAYSDGHMVDQLQKELLRRQEEEAERSKQCVKKEAKFRYRSKEELLATSPSVRDGMTPEKERQWRGQYVRAMQVAGEALRL
jgi:hypothetical protein